MLDGNTIITLLRSIKMYFFIENRIGKLGAVKRVTDDYYIFCGFAIRTGFDATFVSSGQQGFYKLHFIISKHFLLLFSTGKQPAFLNRSDV